MTVDEMSFPRLLEGLVVAACQDRCVIDGGPRTELFIGPVAGELLPQLLALLDGTRPLAEIAKQLDLTPEYAGQLIGSLQALGLVVLTAEPAGQAASPPMPAFLRRSVPSGFGDVAHQRIRRSRVAVHGDTALAHQLADLLEQSGVGAVERAGRTEPGGMHDLIVVVAADGGTGLDRAWPGPGAGAPWLAVLARQDQVQVGPMFNVPGGGCWPCALAHHQAKRQACPEPGPGPAEVFLAGLGAARAAATALGYLGGYGSLASRADVTALRPGPDGSPGRALPRRPDCPSCGRPGVRLEEQAAAEFGRQLAPGAPPWGAELQPLERDPRLALDPVRRFLLAPRLPRPPAGSLGDAMKHTIPLLLERSAGVVRPSSRPDRPAARWAPSAGDLGLTRAYVLGDLTGAGPGAYYFDGQANVFAVLPPPGTAAIWDRGVQIVLAGDVPMAVDRLGDAGRQVTCLDAGFTLAQLFLFGRVHGWRLRAHRKPAQDLASVLELDPEREPLIAVAEARPELDSRCQAAPEPGLAAVPAPRLARLVRRPQAYRFTDRSVNAETLRAVLMAAQADAARLWQHGPATRCVLYARDVTGLPRGCYALTRAGWRPSWSAREAGLLEGYLQDRRLDPPALLLMTGDLLAALADLGAAGGPALAARCAALANLVRLTAATAGLDTGLLSRIPAEWWPPGGWPGQRTRPLDGSARPDRVFCGCAIGHAAAGQPGGAETGIRW
jgi:hypothetical protein